MYTVCYVLIDTEQLMFYNEMMVSISSLRYYGYDGPVSIVTDHGTHMQLREKIGELKKYRVDIVEVDIPEKYNQKEKSRYLKTSLRNWVAGDFLFVDTDTVFAGKLPDIISDHEIAMVTDHHYEVLSPNTPTYNYALPRAQKSGIDLLLGEAYFNSGVIWVKDTERTRQLYIKWHETWLVSRERGVAEDQLSLNAVNHQLGNVISHLGDGYNVQITDGETIPFSLLGKCVIIHYFHPGRRTQEHRLTIPEIRQNHFESEVIRDIIASPKTAFVDGKIISTSAYAEMRNLADTIQYQMLKKTYAHPKLFAFIERVLRKAARLYRFFRK